ncbi:MAG TPA: hypothetical protein O0X38_06245 [Methanocorpusculum sp.]|nr:hypothetical protein [Methanocorpusculum sp.]
MAAAKIFPPSSFSATLIGSGIATLLQAFRYTGCGYIFPMVPNSSYLPASMLAATAGGLPLLYGMMIVSGFLEMLFSRLTRYFRILFPGEVIGVVMFMLGLAVIPFSFPLFFGSGDSSPLSPAATAVGIITLGSMIILGIQQKKNIQILRSPDRYHHRFCLLRPLRHPHPCRH